MKLVSQEYGPKSVELTFADSDQEDDASTLLVARLPFEVQDAKSVAWNRYQALKRLHDELGTIVDTEYSALGGK